MKFWHKGQAQPRDERIVSEINKTYRIGFYILSIGILIDLYQKWSAGVYGFWESGLEGLLLVAANVAVLVAQGRRGLMDDNARYAESDRFPLRHYLLVSLAAGVGASVLMCALRLANGSFSPAVPLAVAVLGVSMAVTVTLCCLLAYYGMYRVARRRRAALLEDGGDE